MTSVASGVRRIRGLRAFLALFKLRHSRELTRICSPKMSHELVSDIDRVHVLRGYRRVIWQDLARAKQFAKALLDVASYFFAPRSALQASGVDDARPNPARLRRG